eukprot:3796891-Prymnesium_polylepis.1
MIGDRGPRRAALPRHWRGGGGWRGRRRDPIVVRDDERRPVPGMSDERHLATLGHTRTARHSAEPAHAQQRAGTSRVARTPPRAGHLSLVCVCVLRIDGTWHADGTRVGDAQQTRRATRSRRGKPDSFAVRT